MRTRIPQAHRNLGPVACLAVAGVVALGSAACGTTDFAAADAAGVDGSTGVPDATERDTGHPGSDARPADSGKNDTSTSGDTGTSHDTGVDAGEDHDAGTGSDSSLPRDAGVDQSGPSCSGASCTDSIACPTPVGTCKEAACTAGCCTVENKAAETACTNATGGRVCDGAGACVDCVSNDDCPTTSAPYCALHACVECRTANDCPMPSSDCETPVCSPSGACSVIDVMEGSPCTGEGGHVCNSSGTCVGCNTVADCTTGIATLCEMLSCAMGVCGETPSPAETSCGASMVCNGSGACCETGGGGCLAGG